MFHVDHVLTFRKSICMTYKQSCIAPNGNRKRAGSIQQHFCFHWAEKYDGSLRNEPKINPI